MLGWKLSTRMIGAGRFFLRAQGKVWEGLSRAEFGDIVPRFPQSNHSFPTDLGVLSGMVRRDAHQINVLRWKSFRCMVAPNRQGERCRS